MGTHFGIHQTHDIRYDLTAIAILPLQVNINEPLRECACECFCLRLAALAFFFSICNFHSCASSELRSIDGQANLLRIYRLCKLQKFSNENFNYYAAFEGELCSNNIATTTTAGACLKCFSVNAAERRYNVAVTETNALPARRSAYAANYAHITHTPRCQFPRAVSVRLA